MAEGYKVLAGLAVDRLVTLVPQMEAREETTPASALYAIPNGSAGIRATLNLMARFTREYKTDLTLRNLAERIVQSIAGKDWYGEIQAIQNWVRDNIRYTRDIHDAETLKTPLLLIQSPYGDCDDMAMLAGTLLNALGHPVRYVAVGTQFPGEFDHVFPETIYNNRWISVETTENVPIGWLPPEITARMVGRV